MFYLELLSYHKFYDNINNLSDFNEPNSRRIQRLDEQLFSLFLVKRGKQIISFLAIHLMSYPHMWRILPHELRQIRAWEKILIGRVYEALLQLVEWISPIYGSFRLFISMLVGLFEEKKQSCNYNKSIAV